MEKLSDDFIVFGQHDDGTISQMWTCLGNGGDKAVLCADGHKGYAQPIGGVIAYKDLVSISGVGFDIGCGNLAVQTKLKASDINIVDVMDKIAKHVSFGIGKTNDWGKDHPLFDDETWKMPEIKDFKEMARSQIGTVGSGNHYVDIFSDDDDLVWVGVHFGSRGFGHKTATLFLREAGGKDGMDVAPCVVKSNTSLGQDYLAAMRLAGDYAKAGRETVVDFILKKILFSGEPLQTVHNHHNYAWEEDHFGEKFLVVRKGATPAFPGQKGFIGGSMGDNAVIIEGVESDTSKQALYSTVHGAGRIMSRTAAKGKTHRKTGEILSKGLVDPQEMKDWLTKKGVILRGGDLDEAPQAYRRLTDVLKAHEGTIKVLHTLKPLGVAMAGNDVRDPYKD